MPSRRKTSCPDSGVKIDQHQARFTKPSTQNAQNLYEEDYFCFQKGSTPSWQRATLEWLTENVQIFLTPEDWSDSSLVLHVGQN
jgi:hypothetical protein